MNKTYVSIQAHNDTLNYLSDRIYIVDLPDWCFRMPMLSPAEVIETMKSDARTIANFMPLILERLFDNLNVYEPSFAQLPPVPNMFNAEGDFMVRCLSKAGASVSPSYTRGCGRDLLISDLDAVKQSVSQVIVVDVTQLPRITILTIPTYYIKSINKTHRISHKQFVRLVDGDLKIKDLFV